jgi:excinuclease UvrABC nuclease subunit
MVPCICDVDWIRTGTELEALLLEDSLIKQHWPDFNTRQKKFLRHTYLSLSADLYPVFTIKDRPRRTAEDTSFGPITDVYYARDLLESVNTALGLRSCTDPQPNRHCPHLRGTCLQPCRGSLQPEVYRQAVDLAKEFLSGRNDALLGMLLEKMQMYSDQREYNRAARLRDQSTLCQRFWKRQQFYGQFLRNSLYIEEKPSHFFLFVRGRFIGCRPTRRELDQALIPLEKSVEEESLLFDRAMVVLSWLNNRRSDTRYFFLPAPSPD